MIRRPVRGMRGRAHAGMSGYPANLRRVAGRRDDHLPGVKSSGVRSAVLLWSPDSGSADGRLLFGEVGYPFHCHLRVGSLCAISRSALPRVVCGAEGVVPRRRGLHGLPGLAALAGRAGVPELRACRQEGEHGPSVALRRVPEACLAHCGNDLPGHAHGAGVPGTANCVGQTDAFLAHLGGPNGFAYVAPGLSNLARLTGMSVSEVQAGVQAFCAS